MRKRLVVTGLVTMGLLLSGCGSGYVGDVEYDDCRVISVVPPTMITTCGSFLIPPGAVVLPQQEYDITVGEDGYVYLERERSKFRFGKKRRPRPIATPTKAPTTRPTTTRPPATKAPTKTNKAPTRNTGSKPTTRSRQKSS